MIKIASISIAKLSLKNINKKRLLLLINFVIFLSIFAISASVISLFHERKIEKLSKELSSDYGNEIIYDFWLSESPKNIRNIESIINKISTQHDYLIYIKALEDRLISDRDLIHNPIMDLIRFNRHGLNSLNLALKDALIISNSEIDLLEINKFSKIYYELKRNFSDIANIDIDDHNKIWVLSNTYKMQNSSKEVIKKLYKVATLEKKNLKNILNDIKNINTIFIINYYSRKKNESQNKIINNKNEIKQISKKESQAILFAFAIQIIIFIIIQFFEFGFEVSGRIKKKLK